MSLRTPPCASHNCWLLSIFSFLDTLAGPSVILSLVLSRIYAYTPIYLSRCDFYGTLRRQLFWASNKMQDAHQL